MPDCMCYLKAPQNDYYRYYLRAACTIPDITKKWLGLGGTEIKFRYFLQDLNNFYFNFNYGFKCIQDVRKFFIRKYEKTFILT